MPAAVAGVAGAIGSAAAGVAIAVGASAATAVAVATTVATISFYALAIGGPLLIGRAISAALAPKIPESNISRNRILELVTSGKQAGRIIYGEARVGGYLAAPWAVTGTSNEYLWAIVVFAAHEIEDYEFLYLGEDELDRNVDFNASGECLDSRYIDNSGNRLLKVKFYDGTQTTVDADWNAAFTQVGTNHILQGLAYCVIRMEQDLTGVSDVWANGPPRQISARIQGKKVFDPRTSTTVYSNNPALCLRDYITDELGLGEPASRVDDDAVIAAANICDESITVRNDLGGTKTINRYECDGVLSTGTAPATNMETIASSMAGTFAFVGSGEWRIWAGAWTAPVADLDEGYLGAKGYRLVPQASAADRYNVVSGTYVDYRRGAIPVPFPARESATYQTDDGAELTKDVQLAMTRDTQRAQVIAHQLLQQSRNWELLEWHGNLRCFDIELWDVVNVTLAELGYTSKTFRVAGWRYQPMSVTLLLKADTEAAYDFTTADLVDDPAPDDLE